MSRMSMNNVSKNNWIVQKLPGVRWQEKSKTVLCGPHEHTMAYRPLMVLVKTCHYQNCRRKVKLPSAIHIHYAFTCYLVFHRSNSFSRKLYMCRASINYKFISYVNNCKASSCSPLAGLIQPARHWRLWGEQGSPPHRLKSLKTGWFVSEIISAPIRRWILKGSISHFGPYWLNIFSGITGRVCYWWGN